MKVSKPDSLDAVIVKDLEKRFGNFVAVDRISFSVKKGEIFGFLGPNGAGKSTTIRMLCGIITPTSGYGRVAGYDVFIHLMSRKGSNSATKTRSHKEGK